jgi:cell division protein FtsB
MSQRRKPSPQPSGLQRLTQSLQQVYQTVLTGLTLPLRRSGVHLVTLALVLLTISLLINFGGQVLQATRLEARRTSLATEVAQIEAENQDLQGAVEYAESNANVERVAREQLGYTRAGDTVLLPQFPAATPTPTAAPPDALPPPAQEPNWRQWWGAVFPPSSME